MTQALCPLGEVIVTKRFAFEDAYLVSLALGDRLCYGLSLGGRGAQAAALNFGELTVHDLRLEPTFELHGPFNCLFFYLNRQALDAIADEAGSTRIAALTEAPGRAIADPIMRDLGLMLLAILAQPNDGNRLFTDTIMSAVGVHLTQKYGGLKSRSRLERGGLAPWQERRAKDILSANLLDEVSLDVVAHECGLSKSYFSRSFRVATGLAPHQWLLQRRVEAAESMLITTRLKLVEIALACGFADQSHFTRVFSRVAGLTPGAWRRNNSHQQRLTLV